MMRVGSECPTIMQRSRFAIVPYTRGKGLDVGTGDFKAHPHFIGVREKRDDTVKLPVNADFLVESFTDMKDFIEGELDFAYIWGPHDDTPAIIAQCVRLLKIGGHLIVAQEQNENGKLMIVRKVSNDDSCLQEVSETRPEKSALVIRYGAIGDSLQTASVFPELKRLGYHITFNSHPDGEVVLRHDPHIDRFMTQDKDQVMNGDLVEYWKFLDRQYDRVVNLCESVEGSLLLYPGRANHRWAHSVRKKECST